jgi:hypothetical protein
MIPQDYDQVVIDVRDVQINVSTDSSEKWQSLSTVKAGSYDLLRLVIDDDTLLGNSDIPTGTLHQMRLVLGSNNYVVVNGQKHSASNTKCAAIRAEAERSAENIASGILYTITLEF